MKSLGVNYFRSQDEENWTKNMSFRLEGVGSVVISDVRFQNEAAAIVRERGGVLICVSRDMESNSDDHVSEQTTDAIECDLYIRNDGTMNDLRVRLKTVLLCI